MIIQSLSAPPKSNKENPLRVDIKHLSVLSNKIFTKGVKNLFPSNYATNNYQITSNHSQDSPRKTAPHKTSNDARESAHSAHNLFKNYHIKFNYQF